MVISSLAAYAFQNGAQQPLLVEGSSSLGDLWEDDRLLLPAIYPLRMWSDMDATRNSIAQAAAAGALFCIYVARRFLPRAPQWMRSFAKEEPWQTGASARGRTLRLTWPMFALPILSMLGLVVSNCFVLVDHEWYHALQTNSRWLDTIPWVTATLVALIGRPRTTPKTLLALFSTVVVGDMISLVATFNSFNHVAWFQLVCICIALAAIIIILSMPMRDPLLAKTGIAGPHDGATDELRSPEDDLTLWQFMTVSWMAPLMKVGSKQRLDDEDVWQLPYEFQHGRLHVAFRDLKGSIFRRLLLANGLDLIIITLLGTLEAAANLSNPILLQRLLRSIELSGEGVARRNEALYWAAVILVVRLVACQCGVFAMWFSRRAYERSRGEMITTIYAKALTRKSQGFQPSEKDPAHQNGNSIKDENKSSQRWFARLLSCLGFRKKSPTKAHPQPKPPATMGKILNLMRNDVYEVAQRFWDFSQFITRPLQLILSLALLWLLLGWPCLLGIAWVVIVQFLNAAAVYCLLVQERLRRAATDVRLHVTSQFIEALRPLRWYDWQTKWLTRIVNARRIELRLKVITGLWNIAISTINTSAGALFPVISFFAFTWITKKPLSVDLVFPALNLFSMLETSVKQVPELIYTLLNASVAMGRLEAFLDEPDKDEGFANEPTAEIEFKNASFAWPGIHHAVLHDMTLNFPTGLTVVCGEVGSGKSALLHAVLGELDRLAGHCVLPNEVVGYCAQAPWLQHMSIRDNILFCAPYEPGRYRRVVEACALTPDLANFPHGDLTSIGENGIGLSGGQKARVALARAVYSRSQVLLLDDPLAPLDHDTAQSIVQNLFCGDLVRGRTIILVTHRVDLCVHLADQVIEMRDGKARVLDSDEVPRQILESEAATAKTATKQNEQTPAATEADDDAAIPDEFIEEEHRASGGVMMSVYWTYIKAGMLSWWAVLVAILAIQRFARLFSSWFLKAFSEAYKKLAVPITRGGASLPVPDKGGSFASGFFDRLPRPYDDVTPWLLLYLIIAVVVIVMEAASQGSMLLILYTAAKNLFIKVITRVSGATFRYYDVTPVGRLMNRLTSDIGMLDGGIIRPLNNVAFWSLTWISCMVIIALTTPTFFLFALGMTVGFIYIFMRFLPSSQSLRRLEMASLSPLMSNVGILTEGLATIRAFQAQTYFQSRNVVVTDAFQQKDHFYWSLQTWLQYRFDSWSAASNFILAAIALYNGLTPGLTAFVLTTASQFVEATHALCREYGTLQMDFVSVERVVELLDLEEEPNGDIEPPANWPAYGDDISFDSVTMRYAPHLEPSLSEVSFTIPGGSTCAVLGRTGSGKSTLALALLATLRPDTGSIKVGSMDISKVNVHTWRQRVTFIAQDPVLFPGTLRQNLDPLEEHSDKECIDVLRRILGPEWSLTSHVEAGGKNLSQGQRQLVGIGRAVLRRSPVIILDEATASIDQKTAMAIQDVLRDELRRSTVITIAHRLEAVKDVDYFVRLDAGRVIDCGPTSGIR